MKRFSCRAVAASLLVDVIWGGEFLDRALVRAFAALPVEYLKHKPLIQELSYGTVRWAIQLNGVAQILLEKPLKKKDRDVLALLMVGLYQLTHTRIQPHAAVNETVSAAGDLGKSWSKNLINACLRRFLRGKNMIQGQIQSDPVLASSHPDWLLSELKRNWPNEWRFIIEANNQHPPFTLRIAQHKLCRNDYLKKLTTAGLSGRKVAGIEAGVIVDPPVPVTQLPGFDEGLVSVQDGAAQLAATLLDAKPGDSVLDACAAPGGKLAHILEQTRSKASLTAVEIDPARVKSIEQTLVRLGLEARIIQGDAAEPDSWWDGKPFDCILVDAPCSATGVIRRHPDVKLHRTPEDVADAVQRQARILDGLLPLLKSGGRLLYVTCSVLVDENEKQIEALLSRHSHLSTVPLGLENVGFETNRAYDGVAGYQILPGEHDMDGFYYACIQKA